MKEEKKKEKKIYKIQKKIKKKLKKKKNFCEKNLESQPLTTHLNN